MTESVSVLEEGLGIETVLSDNFTEVVDYSQDERSLFSGGLTSAIDGVDAHLTDGDIDTLFKTLGGENLVNLVRELSPLDMLAFLGSLESVGEELKLTLGDWTLSHCETDTELGGGDVAGAQSIEIAEELRDTNSLLFAESADASNNIIDIIRCVAHDLSDAAARLSFREVGHTMVEALVDTEELLGTVNILTEVNVVHLIDIAFVHVSTEDHLDDVLGSSNSE